jgi:LAO/AO transport system kinase
MNGINPNRSFRRPLRPLAPADYVTGILQRDRMILSRAITLIESTLPEHRQIAESVIEKCLPYAGKSLRIGITGTPGVGKSTFIEAFGMRCAKDGNRLAVLAIDPTSRVSGGSILGDKTRMPHLSVHPDVFIRPSPAGDSLGGVARKTRETIVLCEAAGFNKILVETVGVGQSETAVREMTDFFLLLLLPGAGDDLQGIKRGIVEAADLIAVNKADGDNEKLARQAQQFYKTALHFFPPKESGWIPQVTTCSAFSGLGLDSILEYILNYKTMTENNGFFEKQRGEQAAYWFKETILETLHQRFYNHPSVQNSYQQIENQIIMGKISPFAGAEDLLKAFFKG